MDSPPESVLALSCEPLPTSPTLPSLDHSPLDLHNCSPPPFQLSSYPCEEDNEDNEEEEEEENEEKEISVPPSPTPAVALFPGGQETRSPSPDNSPPDMHLEPTPLREALPGFGALELALSSTQDPSCSDELDLQLFHNGRPSGEEGERSGPDGAGIQQTPPALKFPCKVCGKRFRFNSILSLHARAHIVERERASFVCQRCGLRASSRASLAMHLKSCHNQSRAPEPGSRSPTEGCPLGSPGASETPSNLSPVFAAQESAQLTPPPMEDAAPMALASTEDVCSSSAVAFRCHACKGKFRTASELSRHVRILHNPYKCTMCPFSASREEDLASHLQESHPAMSPVEVEGDLTPCVPAVAPPPPPAFRCETCGQRFTQSWFLKGHMRKHKDSLDHKCQVCGRGFKEPWFLKNHMKVHLNKLGLKASLSGTVSDDQAKVPSSGQALGTLYSSVLLAHGGGGSGETGGGGRAEREALAKLAAAGSSEAGGSGKVSLMGYLGLPGDGGGASCMERLQAVAQVAEMGSGGGGAGGLGDQAAVWHMVARSLAAAQQAQHQQPHQRQQRPRQRTHRSSVAGEAEQVRAYLGGLVSREVPPGASWECPDCGKLFRSLQQAVAHARVHSQRPPKTEDGGKRSGGGGEGRVDISKAPGSQQQAQAAAVGTVTAGGFHAMLSQFQGENGLRSISSGQPVGPRERVRGTGVKDCPYCGKAFRSSHHLKVHLRVHTGERPYKCPHCDYAGTQSGSLKYHLQRHHREQRSSSSGTNASSTAPTRAHVSLSPGARVPYGQLGPKPRRSTSTTSQSSVGRLESHKHGQQWHVGPSEHRERRAGGSQRSGGKRIHRDQDDFHYNPGVMGGHYLGAAEGTWAGEVPQAKLAKVSRRKPVTTSRMVPTNGQVEGGRPRGQQERFEPLDLSRRPSPGQGSEEDGGGVTLNQCLFCPFRTSSAELMAMHLQVNHTSKSRRKRSSIGETWSHREVAKPSLHPGVDPIALWKSWRDDTSRLDGDWASSTVLRPNGCLQDGPGAKITSNSTTETNPDSATVRNMYECDEEEEVEEDEEEEEQEEEEMEGDKEGENSSLSDSPKTEGTMIHSPALGFEESTPVLERGTAN